MNNIDREFEIYGEGLFFVEFSRWPGKKLEYRLFQKNFIHSEVELEKYLAECETDNERAWMRMQNEGHPYQLLCGEVNEMPGVICFETKEFLKFTVDKLNS